MGSSRQEKRMGEFANASKRHSTNEERLRGNQATRRLLFAFESKRTSNERRDRPDRSRMTHLRHERVFSL